MQPLRYLLAALRIVAGVAIIVVMLKIAPTIAGHAAVHASTYSPAAAAMTAPRTK
ncbi:MAG: hypothetical protein IPM22_07525 [Betaproteobacteria bacterium]|jgi:hypothetical protein|nr:hypothetical protein [Betaproteobacteria bacterium]MCC7216824.1 hypothetical protein [Burkholderiales bacterium]